MEAHVGELETFLKDYPALRIDRQREKVCCCLTGHEMPMRVEVVRSYVQGKKFRRVQQDREYDYDQHKPHLVPNIKSRMQHTLFCTLTYRCVTKRPSDVEGHVKGKRFQKALKRWQECQKTGEKFVPRGRSRASQPEADHLSHRKAKRSSPAQFWEPGHSDHTDSGGDGEEQEADHDDMADLYPSEESQGESGEEEEDDEDSSHDVHDGQASLLKGKKRKLSEPSLGAGKQARPKEPKHERKGTMK